MDSDPDATDRLRALEMDQIHELFSHDRFPATTEEILAEYGDVVVRYEGGGSDRLATILNTSGHETYRTIDDLQLAVLNGVQRDAVGRPRYSDRSPALYPGQDRDHRRSF